MWKHLLVTLWIKFYFSLTEGQETHLFLNFDYWLFLIQVMLETSITVSSKSWSFIRSVTARTKAEHFPQNRSTSDGIQFTIMRCPDDMPIQHTHMQRLECLSLTHTEIFYIERLCKIQFGKHSRNCWFAASLSTHLHIEPSVEFKLANCFFRKGRPAEWEGCWNWHLIIYR